MQLHPKQILKFAGFTPNSNLGTPFAYAKDQGRPQVKRLKTSPVTKRRLQMKRRWKIRALVALAFAMLIAMGCGLAQAAKEFNGTVNINTANVEQLTELPGIGPAKAQAIVEYRTNSPFKTVDEIMQVKGIGEKLFAKLSPHLTVNGQTRLGSDDSKQPGGGAKARK